MRIIPQSTIIGNYGYNYSNVYRAENKNSPTFKSIYNPNSIIHKTSPFLKLLDGYYARSLLASRRLWYPVDVKLEPYLKVIDIEDKKTPHVRMWDINDNNKQKYAIVLHGLSHNISSLQEMYKKIISDTEYAVIAPEYHGLTPENEENIYIEPKHIMRDVKLSVKYLNEKGIENKNIAVIGHSFGGFVASKLAKEYPDIEDLILVSVVNPKEYVLTKMKQGKFKLPSQSTKNILSKNSLFNIIFKFVFNTTKQLKKVKSPVDIIHAKSDTCVTINHVVDMAYHCQNLRTINMVDGFHAMDKYKINVIIELLNQNINK